MNKSQQIVLITGGSSGIGLALAKKFMENDNTVIITGRNLQKLEAVQRDFPQIHIFQSDVTDSTEVKKLAADIDQQFNGCGSILM